MAKSDSFTGMNGNKCTAVINVHCAFKWPSESVDSVVNLVIQLFGGTHISVFFILLNYKLAITVISDDN